MILSLPGCAHCHLNTRYWDELGCIPWSCSDCGHTYTSYDYWAGPWKSVDGTASCSSCVYGTRHPHTGVGCWIPA